MKNIIILATGGTIAGKSCSRTDTSSYQSAILPIEDLLNEISPLKEIANITSEQLAQIDSADMTHDHWLHLAKHINFLLKRQDVDGIVVTHGTDTLEETAYFLNLVVKSEKPVVLVGAMRPATAISPDGPMNLYNAVILAASPLSQGKGVLVTLNDTINCSRDVTKTNTSLQDTFKAPELGYLGYMADGEPHFYRSPTRKHTYMTEFEIETVTSLPLVHILYGHVNDTGALAYAALQDGARGIIYAGVGNGNMSHTIEKVLQDISQQGVLVVRSTRVNNGIVLRNGAINDDRNHFITADTLSPQNAKILLMLALTKTTKVEDVQTIFKNY